MRVILGELEQLLGASCRLRSHNQDFSLNQHLFLIPIRERCYYHISNHSLNTTVRVGTLFEPNYNWMQVILGRILRHFSKQKQKSKKAVTPIDPAVLAHFNSLILKHKPRKTLPSAQGRNILITSALPYVNNTPHLGNIIGAVLSADVYARYCRLMGYNVLYVCGTDEYGTATQVKALQEKTTPQQICDKFHKVHKDVYQWFNISFDHFGRTSQPVHSEITQMIFNSSLKGESIVEKQSQQVYCQSCDIFLADRYIKGTCSSCGTRTRGDQCQNCNKIFDSPLHDLTHLECSICKNEPVAKNTKHIYLKLGSQVERLKQWLLQEGGMATWSNNAKGVTKGWLHGPYPDRCITRDLKWGVPVPKQGYDGKVFYVWFQAPIGYISITADWLGQAYKKWWLKQDDTNVELKQFMGKDNTLFHSVIFPTTLMSSNLPWILPQQLSVTEYLNYEGGKFSKSKNFGVFGDQCQSTGLSSDYWRYYLLRVRPQSFDSEFTWDDFAQKCNKQLLNSVGNLVQRVLKAYRRQFKEQIKPLNEEQMGSQENKLIQQLQRVIISFRGHLQKIQIVQGTMMINQYANLVNQYVGLTQFWRSQKKSMILALLIRVIRVMSWLLQPYVPGVSAKINHLLGCRLQTADGIYQQLTPFKPFLMGCLQDSQGVRQPIPLFKQISRDDLQSWKTQFGSHIQ